MRVAQFKAFQWRWAVFVAAGISMIGMGASVQNVSAVMDFLSFVFMFTGGMLLVTGLTFLLPSSNSLDIKENGFSYRRGFRTTFCPWDECGEFSTWRQKVFGLTGTEVVAFDRKDHARDGKTGADVNGKNSVLPGTYGLGADELAKKLNHFRAVYLGGKQAASA